MTARALFGLAALLPVAIGAGPAAATVLTAQLCTGSGEARVIVLPLGKGAPQPADDGTGNGCAKACHAGGARKRIVRDI